VVLNKRPNVKVEEANHLPVDPYPPSFLPCPSCRCWNVLNRSSGDDGKDKEASAVCVQRARALTS
jgi:hypothetical protein